MATVHLVEESEATGVVLEVYQDIMTSRKLAKVPNYWKALANQPGVLEVSWEKFKTVMAEGALDRRTKEIIAVAVSATNNCAYCLQSHTDALRSLGLGDAELVELMAVVDFFNGSNAMASGLMVEYVPPVPQEEEGQPPGAATSGKEGT
ncbi:MAG TPA: carboxymuconolactone decarboxylase family protein [Candidatus Dormibacteraeota bacterium]|nr:carboxymuconolactone decarboxylase family protein [Candidatus Dormibacteraeota bacterium]